jgi:hypothetical protein
MPSSIRRAALPWCVLCLACSDSPSNPAPDAGPPPMDSALPDAGTDAGEPECTRNEMGECHLFAWLDGTTYPVPVDHHTAFIRTTETSARLFIAGGVQNNPEMPQEGDAYDAVRSAEIMLDGSLGPWQDEEPLPLPLAFHSQVVTDERVYLIGGLTTDAAGPAANPAILVADFEPDGGITAFRDAGRSARLRVPRLHATSQIVNGRLYVIGGSAGNMLTASVVSCEVNADGSLGTFVGETDLPTERSHATSVAIDGSIYVLGGFSGSTTMPVERRELLRADIATDGMITWTEVGMLEDPPWTHATFMDDGYVYLVGGGDQRSGGRYLARIRRAKFMAEERGWGPFEDVADALPFARAHVHYVPTLDGRLYSVGGRDFATQESQSRVAIGRFIAEHEH